MTVEDARPAPVEPAARPGKTKRAYPLNAKNLFGLSTMRWTMIAGTSLMTSALMLYLTDYSGLADAAVVATVLLAAGRVLDAVDDPLQAFIMDRSPVTRIGKYKPFLLGGIVLATIAILMLFNMPRDAAQWVKIAFLAFAYVLFEIGLSFQPDMAIRATMTSDPKIREKLLVTPRIVEQVVAVPFSFFIAIALMFGAMAGGDNHRGFSLTTLIFVVPIAIVAFIGALSIKEGPYAQPAGDKVGLRDVVAMFRGNPPLWVSQLAGFIGGCIFPFVIAAAAYYIKWAFGPANFGTYSAVFGASILLGIIVGTILAPIVLKRTTPARGVMVCALAQVVPLALIYVLHFVIAMPPVVFFVLLFAMMVASGMGYIPGSLINMECMDYNRWKRGKGLEAMVQAVGSFTTKAQTALAGLATGAVLLAIHYDAALYESEDYVNAGGTVPPELLNGLVFVLCLIPVILGVVAAVVIAFYPLKKDERDRMYSELRSTSER